MDAPSLTLVQYLSAVEEEQGRELAADELGLVNQLRDAGKTPAETAAILNKPAEKKTPNAERTFRYEAAGANEVRPIP